MAVSGSLATLCQLIQQLIWELAPANSWKQLRWVAAKAPSTGFGAGGSNLQVSKNGEAVATEVTPIPDGVRSVLLRNLSSTTTVLFWSGGSSQATPPANGYGTIPASQAVAIDSRADILSGLWFMPDPAATDAGVEALITYYDPTKAPGPQQAPFSEP